MQTSATAVKIRTEDKPKTQIFSLKTPYMKQGRVTQLVAETPNMWIHTKINAEGGENEIHKHLNEDHAFIVLGVCPSNRKIGVLGGRKTIPKPSFVDPGTFYEVDF